MCLSVSALLLTKFNKKNNNNNNKKIKKKRQAYYNLRGTNGLKSSSK